MAFLLPIIKCSLFFLTWYVKGKTHLADFPLSSMVRQNSWAKLLWLKTVKMEKNGNFSISTFCAAASGQTDLFTRVGNDTNTAFNTTKYTSRLVFYKALSAFFMRVCSQLCSNDVFVELCLLSMPPNAYTCLRVVQKSLGKKYYRQKILPIKK